MRRLTSPVISSGEAQEHVQGVADHPLGGVLHRHHPVVAGARLDLAEDLADGGHGDGAHRVAELLERRRLGEGPLRPQKGGLQRLLQGQAGGHDLAEEPRHLLAVQGTRVALLDPPQDRRLPLRAVKLDRPLAPPAPSQAFLIRPTSWAQRGAVADQAQDLHIDGIDALAHLAQLVLGGWPLRSWPWRQAASFSRRDSAPRGPPRWRGAARPSPPGSACRHRSGSPPHRRASG